MHSYFSARERFYMQLDIGKEPFLIFSKMNFSPYLTRKEGVENEIVTPPKWVGIDAHNG